MADQKWRGHGAEQLSETFGVREGAVADAAAEAGEGGLVLIEGPGGHIEREVRGSRLRPNGI